MKMKVSELIELLQDMNEEAEVHFSYNYGDHWRTKVSPSVDEVYDGYIEYSDYHRMYKLIDEYSDDVGDARKVVVLS